MATRSSTGLEADETRSGRCSISESEQDSRIHEECRRHRWYADATFSTLFLHAIFTYLHLPAHYQSAPFKRYVPCSLETRVRRVYLPTLLDPDLCYKLPIAVGYTCVTVGKVRKKEGGKKGKRQGKSKEKRDTKSEATSTRRGMWNMKQNGRGGCSVAGGNKGCAHEQPMSLINQRSNR